MATPDKRSEVRDLIYRFKYRPHKSAYEPKVDDVMKAVDILTEDAYERGYNHGHKIGCDEGKSAYEPESNINENESDIFDGNIRENRGL